MGIDRQTVVIGAGLAGLACAYRLQQLGVSFELLEASDRVGGVIAAVQRNGFLFESGPQCPRFPRALRSLVREIGLEGEFVRANPRARRYVLKGGRLHPAPLSPWALLATRLVGFREKARFVAEPFGKARPPENEESLADCIRRKFGTETLDYLVDPFASAVFFADPEDMGMEGALPSLVRWEREHGSVFRGAIKSRNSNGRQRTSRDSMTPADNQATSLRLSETLPPLGSFRSGFARVNEALAKELGASLRLNARVENVRAPRHANDAWCVRLGDGEEIRAGSVVIAAPAYEAGCLVRLSVPPLSKMLEQIPYSPLAVVCSAYDRAQVRHSLKGFGFVVPKREGLRTISCTWNSSIFPGRAPEGKVLITTFARPLSSEDSFLENAPERTGGLVEEEVSRILGISGSPLDRMAWSFPRALPHFRIGHARRVSEIREFLRGLPGLHLAGNYFAGRSVGDCVEIGFESAEGSVRHIKAAGGEPENTPESGRMLSR